MDNSYRYTFTEITYQLNIHVNEREINHVKQTMNCKHNEILMYTNTIIRSYRQTFTLTYLLNIHVNERETNHVKQTMNYKHNEILMYTNWILAIDQDSRY